MKYLKKPAAAWKLAAMDILLTAVLLVVFALFHHVLPGKSVSAAVEIATATPTATPAPTAQATPVPAAEETAQVTAEPTAEPTPDPVGCFASKFADKFVTGDPVVSESEGAWSYVSANINVSVEQTVYTSGSDTATCYVADIYLKNIKSLVTGFANDRYSEGGNYEWLTSISERYGAVLSVNGDFYSTRKYGAVIRNGKAYRTKHSNLDACVIYEDGTMRTFDPADFNAETEVKNGAWQAWNFGPRLLTDDGQPMTDFNSNTCKHNPRTAIGYFEPGHYCFVVVDGRSDDSSGLKMAALSQLMYELGCKAAYNLDGGKTSSMAWMSDLISNPVEGGRKIPDNVMILDVGE